jgi:hypothetical protein
MPAPLRRAFSLKTVKLHLGHVADVLHCHAHAVFGWDVPVDVADLSWALLP